jgi:hypothetical protein
MDLNMQAVIDIGPKIQHASKQMSISGLQSLFTVAA